MHELKVIHRDLKLPNILIHDGILKIADLGFARVLDEQDCANTILGTPLTMAPEVLKQEVYTIKADMYSMGVIFYQILFEGAFPFNARSE